MKFSRKIPKKHSYILSNSYILLLLFLFSFIPLQSQVKVLERARVVNLAVIDSNIRFAPTQPQQPVHPPKIALIIGNANYSEGNELDSPEHDADTMAENFKELGFDVMLLKNTSRSALRKAIILFIRKSKHAHTTFFYFSGHLVKSDNANFLVPTDATLEDETQLKDQTISLDYLIRKLNRKANNRIAIDACYPNSFGVGTQNPAEELCFSPPAKWPDDTFISFSAYENQLAPVVAGDDISLFCYLFAFNLQQQVVYNTFMDTKKLVKKFSSGKQDVYYYGKMSQTEYWGPYQFQILAQTQASYPKFSWPPPFASASEQIDEDFFTDSQTLGDINKKLLRSLDNQGYFDTSHYAIEEGQTNGFAIATRLEQINEDASSLDGDDRWNKSLVSTTSDFSLSQYLKSLFFPREGYFRVIVFAVVNQPFSTSGGNATREEVITWVSGGASDLEDSIAGVSSNGYKVYALIYEYRLPENDITATIEDPSGHAGRIHLEKSGLWAQLAGTE
ncbi:MAG: caspase family protein [Bacteroidota bacterium]